MGVSDRETCSGGAERRVCGGGEGYAGWGGCVRSKGWLFSIVCKIRTRQPTLLYEKIRGNSAPLMAAQTPCHARTHGCIRWSLCMDRRACIDHTAISLGLHPPPAAPLRLVN